MMMRISNLLEAEAAPLACRGCVFISAVELNILHGMSETKLIHSSAPGGISIDLNNRESIDELLSIGFVGFH